MLVLIPFFKGLYNQMEWYHPAQTFQSHAPVKLNKDNEGTNMGSQILFS